MNQQKLQQNVQDFSRMLDQFEAMFMNIQGDLDFTKLKSLEELKNDIKQEEKKEDKDKRRQSAIVKFEVCDKFGFIK